MSQFSKIKILVVDDEQQMTKLLKTLLEEELECQPETANDPQVALEILSAKEFDVISLDHTMPRVTGMALLKKLRTTPGPNQNTPVMIFTGFLEEAKAMVPEIYDKVIFLEKPIDDDRYLRNIKIAYSMKIS